MGKRKRSILLPWALFGVLSVGLLFLTRDVLPKTGFDLSHLNEISNRGRRYHKPMATFALGGAANKISADKGMDEGILVFRRINTHRTEYTDVSPYLWWVIVIAGCVILILLIFLLLENRRRRVLETDIKGLRAAQMNPHFLSNSLNAIEHLIHQRKNREAAKYIVCFSRFSHQVLQRSRRPTISLQEEVQLLGYFLELEKLRFQNKLSYDIEVAADLRTELIEVPALFLQAYVEDAIWDGIKPKRGTGALKIVLKKEDKYLLVRIQDNGIGRDASRALKIHAQQQQETLGVKVSEERVLGKTKIKRAHVETIDLFNASGEAAGTCVQIRLPIKPLKRR